MNEAERQQLVEAVEAARAKAYAAAKTYAASPGNSADAQAFTDATKDLTDAKAAAATKAVVRQPHGHR